MAKLYVLSSITNRYVNPIKVNDIMPPGLSVISHDKPFENQPFPGFE